MTTQRLRQPAIVQANWYDHPQYYDIAFRSETRLEADFIEAACRKYCSFRARRLLEPACGTGRLIAALAARGYRMTGFDLSGPSLDYLRRRLARRGLRASIYRADMADFRVPRRADIPVCPIGRQTGGRQECLPHLGPFDAAYCTFDSFRHLLTEQAAQRHLECVAESLRPGGIYILGFHLLPLDAAEECIERWTGRHGRTHVGVTLRVLATDRRRRMETLRVSLLVRSGKNKALRLRHDFPFRMYTAAQFRRLLGTVPALELCDVYDFWYEIDRPFEFNDDLSDAVFILQKH